jgi:hypothetical protein
MKEFANNFEGAQIEKMRKYASGILNYRRRRGWGRSLKDDVFEHYLQLTKNPDEEPQP